MSSQTGFAFDDPDSRTRSEGLVPVPDGLDSVLTPFWIPASAGMTVVRRSASAGIADGDPCLASSNGYSTSRPGLGRRHTQLSKV